MESRCSVPVGRLWILLALAVTMACQSPSGQAEDVLGRYFRAVQDGDLAELRCLIDPGRVGPESTALTGVTGEEEWVRIYLMGQIEVYERGKEIGYVPLEGDPARTVKLFSLARGAYYDVLRVQRRDGELHVTTEIRSAFSHIDLSGFTPGTTLYLGGAPAGKVEAVVVPRFSGDVSVSVLDRIEVVWRLVPVAADGGCPRGFRVQDATPVEGSEHVTHTTWTF